MTSDQEKAIGALAAIGGFVFGLVALVISVSRVVCG